jgi:hypothetical protein
VLHRRLWVHNKPRWIGDGPIQAFSDSTSSPCKRITNKTQIIKVAFSKNISESLHKIKGARVDCYRWRGGDEVNNRPVGKHQEEGKNTKVLSIQ